MASKPVELPLSSWAPPASPLRIEYSNEVMEEMRVRASAGFYKLSRGGVEVAGLLLGSVQHDSIRILAQLPFEIEYAYGPVFSLSPRDVAQVRKLIEDVSNSNARDSAQGQSYRVLGLYISHSRGGMTLSEEESRLIDQLFPHAWQTVLILKPSRTSETAATFFVREQNGEMRANQPYGLFVVTPVMGERRARPALSADSSLIALADASRNTNDREALATPPQPAAAAQPEPPAQPKPPARPEPAAQPIAPAERIAPPPVPPRAETPAALSEEDILARRALPESKPAPPPIPPPVSPQVATAPQSVTSEESLAETREIPALNEVPNDAAREIERKSLPRPLAALIVDPDPPVAASPAPPIAAPPVPEHPAPAPPAPVSPAPIPLEEQPAPAPEAPEWHEEEQPTPRYRATPWLRWAIPSVALALLLILGYLVYHALNGVAPTVIFFTRDTGDGPEVIWQLKGLGDARSAVITIETNGEARRIDLIRAGRLSGAYKAPFLKGDSRVALDIERASGEAIHRVATLVSADSVVDYLSGGLMPESVPATAAEPERAATEGGTATETTSGEAPDLSLSVRSPEPILATPVEKAATPVASGAAAPVAARPSTIPSSTAGVAPANTPSARQETGRAAGLPAAGTQRPPAAIATPPTPSPEVPIQARVTEAPVSPRTEAPRPVQVAQSNTNLRTEARGNGVGAPAASVSPTAPTSVIRPAQSSPSIQPPPSAAGTPAPAVQPSAPAKPATTRVSAGRSIWTGQLRKNQSLQINGKVASMGILNAALPGQPIRVNVLPGELTPQGLVVYTSNPRYRDVQNALEPPGPTNGWNQTRYRYDPARAHSLIVTGTPSAANGWQGISVQNGDKNTNVIVIDWQAAEP